jgi:UDP-N-acetylmuramoylalanine--D-glutamate ligase
MNAIEKRSPAHKDLVVGLGATGLSIARYLRRNGLQAMFIDSRSNPPGIEDLQADWPNAPRSRRSTACAPSRSS